MAGSDEPLSLNEKNERLLRDLSRSRPRPSAPASPRRTEIRVRKVRLEGRRRLCKLSSGSAADEATEEEKSLDSSPEAKDGGVKECLDSPLEEKTGEDCTDSIRDILDDLSSRMESLSMQKPARRPKPVRCDPVDCKITTSPLALSPDKEEQGKGRTEVKGKAAAHLFSDQEGEDSCTILDGKRQPKRGGNHDAGSIDILDDEDEDDSVCGLSAAAAGSIRMAGTGASRSVEYVLSGNIVSMLYPHQRDGLRWLWALHCGGTGGILGDDMGLGKTMQVCAFLAGLFYSHLIKRALIVAPKTLHAHWMKELSVVGLGEKIRDYSGACTKTRQYELQSILKEGGVLLTTYDIVRNNSKSIRGDWYVHGDQSEEEILWDYIILDEGHIIKNPKTQRAKSLHEIPSAHRIIISGTPIQNNLKELWALFNFCCPEILGDKDMFKTRYENPILRGNDKNASDREKHVGSSVAKELRQRIKPYFLRRLKSEVFFEDDVTSNRLSKKNEIIVWLKLTSCQRRLYEAFLNSELVHASINGSPLAALTILKKICDHPMLLTKKAAEGVLEGMDNVLNREEFGMVEEMAKNLANLAQNGDFQQVDQNVSCKICFIMSLLENLVEEGHIILIFSQTRKMLNLIQEAMFSEGYKFLRIDGTTKVSEREKIVKDFQEGSGAPIFLLTSQVGGLGLTLTKADRVIVVDPAWNPSTDNQSVDRAYRIGQTKDVLVYRLMTCGTIEEKIYKMQVFKGGLFKSATEHKEQTRYFSQKDISELFSLPEQGFDVSLTQQQLHVEHDQQHTMDEALVNHMKFLKKQDIAGISHHSLLFSKTATVKFVQENNEGQSKTGNRIIISSSSVSSSERVVNGAEYAFKPNDEKFSSKTNPARALTIEAKDSPENIEDRIKRLSQTLANKALISKLPDRGERIKRQISELNAQLHEVRDAYKSKQPEVIDLDGLTEDLQRVLTV